VGYNLNSANLNGSVGGGGNAHQLTLNMQLPLVRIQERNNYRASQIAYQRQRRALQDAEDFAVQVVQNEIYLLRQYEETYKIQQRQLELAYLTIDSSLEALQAPTPPGNARSGQDGPAALTQQLLNAQRSLPASQNALLTLWINYLDARLQLYRDLELMPLDARGVWIDEIRNCDCSLNAELPSPRLSTGGIEQQQPQQPQFPEPRKLPSIPKKLE
jgi:outer membrane protein TolC